MAFIGFTVPAEAAQKLAGVYTMGEGVEPSEMHVTACFLGRKVGAQKVIRAIQACYAAASSSPPLKMTAALLATFPENPDHRQGVPVIARVVSKELLTFRAKLAASLDAFGVEYSKKFPEYKPHVSLAYGDAEFPAKKMEPVSWTCSHLMVWGGEERWDGIFAGVPLSG